MGKVIALVNQKGGVAKSSSAINLSYGLIKKGKKVLLIDLDAQGNATTGTGIDKRTLAFTSNDLLVNDMVKGIECLNTSEGLDVIGANINLASAEVALFNKLARESVLKNKLAELKNNYDYIFIDCAPSLSILTVNALVASDKVYIPVETEYFALEGIEQLLNTINTIKVINPALELGGVFATKFDLRHGLSNDVYSSLKEVFGNDLLETKIRINIAIAKSQGERKNIFDYDSSSNGAKDYAKLVEEILEREGE